MKEDLADRLVQVGIRAMPPPQHRQAECFGVDVISMRDWANDRRPDFTDPVYVSIDVDAPPPVFAPNVSHREPGGLSVRDVLDLLHGLDVPLVGGDVVVYNPTAGRGRPHGPGLRDARDGTGRIDGGHGAQRRRIGG